MILPPAHYKSVAARIAFILLTLTAAPAHANPSVVDLGSTSKAIDAEPKQDKSSSEAAANSTVEKRTERLRSAVDSMKVEQHEVRPSCSPCLGWGKKPLVVMGTEPDASSLPPNWPGIKFPEWKAIVSWFVIYEGAGGNSSTNAAVEVSGIELWYLSKTKKAWQLIQSAQIPKWDSTFAADAVTLKSKSALRIANKSTNIYIPTASNIVHGGLAQSELPWNQGTNKTDVDALYLSIRHRLVLKSATEKDDRASANFAIQAGIDYYPYMGARLSDLNAPYVPGAGLGQFIKVSPEWRYSTVFLKSRKLSDGEILNIQPPGYIY